jgi:hypothetical protein
MTPDYKYGVPSIEASPGCTFFPSGNLKGRVYHSRHSHGIEFNCDGAIDPASVPGDRNDGIKGTMVDIDLAVTTEPLVPFTLHVTDAITVTNMAHGGAENGFSKNEGLIMASEDPVALDLFAARYLYKNVPRHTIPPHPFAMYTPFTDVHFDAATATVVSNIGGYEYPVEKTDLFAYAEQRGLGSQQYFVRGKDITETEPRLLVSQDGHFGRLVDREFEEIITQPLLGPGLLPHYTSLEGPLWPLQNTFRGLAQAADQLTLARIPPAYQGYQSKYAALDEDLDGDLDFADEANDVDYFLGIFGVGYNILASRRSDRGLFHLYLKTIKYADPAWNTQGTAWRTDQIPMVTALSLAAEPKDPSATLDQFFGFVYGADQNGMTWPSLQWARYVFELDALGNAYQKLAEYATEKGYLFNLFVPNQLPYFPFAIHPFLALGLPGITETDDPNLMFVAKLYDTGQEVEQW